MYRAILSKPPSTNHIYGLTSRGGFARSYITPKGVAWFAEAILLLRTQMKIRQLNSPLKLIIELHTARVGDVDGIIKPTQDSLEKAGIIVNDKLIEDLHVRRFKVKHIYEEKVVIELSELS